MLGNSMGPERRPGSTRLTLVGVVALAVMCVVAGVDWASTWGPQWRTVLPDGYQVGVDRTHLVLFVTADREPAPVEAAIVSQGPDSVVVEVRTRDNGRTGVALGFPRTAVVELGAPLDRRRVLAVPGQEIPAKP